MNQATPPPAITLPFNPLDLAGLAWVEAFEVIGTFPTALILLMLIGAWYSRRRLLRLLLEQVFGHAFSPFTGDRLPPFQAK